jgi:hypothetical protein
MLVINLIFSKHLMRPNSKPLRSLWPGCWWHTRYFPLRQNPNLDISINCRSFKHLWYFTTRRPISSLSNFQTLTYLLVSTWESTYCWIPFWFNHHVDSFLSVFQVKLIVVLLRLPEFRLRPHECFRRRVKCRPTHSRFSWLLPTTMELFRDQVDSLTRCLLQQSRVRFIHRLFKLR